MRRVVVKIGSAVLAPGGVLQPEAIERLAKDLHEAMAGGARQMLVVTSGAVASGFAALGLKGMPKAITQKQAAAAVGQPRLMQAWSEAFARRGRTVAQVLLTGEDIADRARFLNARSTLLELLERGITPVINENDSVSYAEIKLGDNDRLAALTAQLVEADALVILSSVEGLWAAGRRAGALGGGAGGAGVVDEVRDVREAEALIRPEKSATGVGGMATKLIAAEIAGGAGAHVVIAGGGVERVVCRVLAGERLGTYFVPPQAGAGSAGGRARGGQGARRRWIAHGARARGTLVVDAGAEAAITGKGASLLPRGVVEVRGSFERGAAVEIARESGVTIAKGLTSYSSDEILRIMGRRSGTIAQTLGYAYCDEVVHRDDLHIVATGPGGHGGTR